MTLISSFTFFAYIGPGLGAGAVAAILGLIGAFFLGLFAILWYPVKRMIKGKKKPADEAQKKDSSATDSES